MKTKSLALAGLLTAALLAPAPAAKAADAPVPLPAREIDECARLGRVGDQNGDGKADVLAVQAGTGDLYYYRSTGGRLSPGVKVGHGWDRMIYIRQTSGFCNVPGKARVPSLLAVRSDGVILSYPRIGPGRLGRPERVSTAPDNARSFAVIERQQGSQPYSAPTMAALSGNLVFATLDDGAGPLGSWAQRWDGMGNTARLVGIDGLPYSHGSPYPTTMGSLLTVERNGDLMHVVKSGFWEDHPSTKLGHGWSQMQTITSPGSLDGDSIGDLVARRVDGNLYSYRGRNDGRLGSAVLIGTGWHKMRLLG